MLLGVSLCEVLELVASFTTSPSSSKTESICIFYCVFELGGFTGVSFIDRSNIHLMVFTPWVDNDVSMHKVVGLVVLIPTSPRSSKSESGRKSYHGFCKTCFHVWPGASPGVTGRPTGWPGFNRPLDRCTLGTIQWSFPIMVYGEAFVSLHEATMIK